MLNKAMILHELAQAKIAHLRWVKRVDHLIAGLPVEESFIPQNPTACRFGEWLYGLVGEKLRTYYIFEPTIKQIETEHNALHKVYEKIYGIFYGKQRRQSILHRIIRVGRRKVSKKELEEAKATFILLQEHSKELTRLIEKLEKAVKVADLVILFRQQEKERAANSSSEN
jgi:hypothetical protein